MDTQKNKDLIERLINNNYCTIEGESNSEIVIDKIALKELLIEYGYIAEYGLDMTVDNLINLDGAAREMLLHWLAYRKIEKFTPIEGIDIKYLRDNMKMKEPAIILAYGMLLKDPKRNSALLRKPIHKYSPSK